MVHSVTVSHDGEEHRFVIYTGIPVRELQDLLEAVFLGSVSGQRPVGLEASDGTTYALSTVAKFPTLLKDKTYTLLVHIDPADDSDEDDSDSGKGDDGEDDEDDDDSDGDDFDDEDESDVDERPISGTGSSGRDAPKDLKTWPQLYKRLCVSRNLRVQRLLRMLSVLEARGITLDVASMCKRNVLNASQARLVQRQVSVGHPAVIAIVDDCLTEEDASVETLEEDVVRLVVHHHLDDTDGGFDASGGDSDSDYTPSEGESDDDDAFNKNVDESDEDYSPLSDTSDDEDDDAEFEHAVDSDSEAADPRSFGRPDAPTPAAGELRRVVEDMVESGEITAKHGETLKTLISNDDMYVFAAYEVFVGDKNHDLEELKDTLQRIAALAPVRGAASSTSRSPSPEETQQPQGYPTQQLEQLINFLLQRNVIHPSEASALRSHVALEDESLAKFHWQYTQDRDLPTLASNTLALVRKRPAQQTQQAPPAVDESVAESDDAVLAGQHAALVDEMRRDAVITGAEATLLRRLYTTSDPVVRAAWGVYLADFDKAELVDTLTRVVARERERSNLSRSHLIETLSDLTDTGRLTQDEGAVLVDIVSNGHQYTELVAAAVEVYLSNNDQDEFIETLKLTAYFANNMLKGEGSPLQAREGKQERLQGHLRSLQEAGLLDDDEFEVLLRLAAAGDHQVAAAFDVFGVNGDEDDLIDTLQRIVRRSARSGANLRPVTGPAPETGDDEQDERNRASEFVQQVFADEHGNVDGTGLMAARLARQGNPAVLAACDVFLIEGDEEDLKDTLVRCVLRFGGSGDAWDSPSDSDDGDGDDAGDSEAGDDAGVDDEFDYPIVEEEDDDPEPPAFSEADLRLLHEQLPYLELSEEGVDALTECFNHGDEVVKASVEFYHAEGDIEDFRDTLRRVAMRAVSVGPLLQPTLGGSTGSLLDELDRSASKQDDHEELVTDEEGSMDLITKALETLVESGDLSPDLRNKVLRKCDDPNIRSFVSGAAQVLQVDNDREEFLDSVRLLV